MNFSKFISIISIFMISHSPIILAQQPYIKKSTSCSKTNNSSSVLGYTCNGLRKTCNSFLTFRAQPPYNSISTISTLLSINPSKLSHLNSVSENQTFLTNQIILVPITCSCSGSHYQANTSYVVEHDDTHFLIAKNTFQGLTTCQALRGQNGNFTRNLYSATRITVPLRCACPSKNQSENGVRYLLTYLVALKESVSSISRSFGVETWKTLAANELSEKDFNIYPSTTLLVPLRDPPDISKVTSLQPPPMAAPPAVPPSSGGAGTAKTWIYGVVGGVLGFFLVIGGIFVILCFGRRKHKNGLVVITSSTNIESVRKEESQDHNFLESMSKIVDENLKFYTIEEIKAATEDFSSSCWIKGSVYRGTINSDYAAIKKMDGSDVGKEINLLSKINHFNLIRLSGVCFDRGHWFLVYEYASNGSLREWIHHNGEEEEMILSWSDRVKIALDVATGLNYLHNYTSPPYVHKDLNSSNVLLDHDFRAKITNLGLARSAEGQNGHFALTRHIVGTKGYMAPEYLEHGLVSPKLDVYAFGVLMMEIFTGKEVSVLCEGLNFELSEVLLEGDEEKLRKLMDPLLRGKYDSKIGLLVLELIDNCIKNDPFDRPSMDEICQVLAQVDSWKNSFVL